MAFDLKLISKFVDAGASRLVGQDPATIATQQAQDAINAASSTLNIDDDAARKVVAMNLYTQMHNNGIVPDDVWTRLPPDLRAVLKYGPADLKFNQTATKIKTFGTPAAILISVLAALGLGISATVAIPAGLVALVWYFNGLANDWNDVFHWGPQFQQQTAIELYKEAQKLDEVGLTDYGQFKMEEVDSLLTALQRAGVMTILNPVSAFTAILNRENLISALKDIISTLNADGTVPTKKQVLGILRGWIHAPQEGAAAGVAILGPTAGVALAGAAGYAAAAAVPRATQYVQVKQKLFLGAIFGGSVANEINFARVVDDKITDEADLLNDAQVNLNKWLATLPGNLTYKINIKLNPVDENNVQKVGTWAVLSMYINNKYNKALFLDDVLLGPLDPLAYYPESYRTLSIAMNLPSTLKGGEVAVVKAPTGGIRVVDKQGNEITDIFETGVVSGPTPGLLTAPGAQAPSAVAVVPTPLTTPASNITDVLPEFSSANGGAAMFIRPIGGIYWEHKLVAKNATEDQYNAFIQRSGAVSVNKINEFNPNLYAQSFDLSKAQVMRTNVVIPQVTVAPAPPQAVAPTPPSPTYPRTVTVNVPVLFVRSEPKTSAPLTGSERLYAGNVFQTKGYIMGENVEGENRWWVSQYGNYVWVGGTKEKP